MPEKPSYSSKETQNEYATERTENKSSSSSSTREQLDNLKTEVSKSNKGK